MNADALLSAQDLSLSRGGRQLFTGLSFDLLPGQIIQVAGENGAGKTSLLRVLAGLARYSYEGRLFSRGRALPGDGTYREDCLYLGHQAAVKGLLTPRENLAWHVDGAGEYPLDAIDQALHKVGLYGYEDVASHRLSAGQHRRVNLARLYLTQRPLWLLDEPFTAIDRDGVVALEAHLSEHVSAGGAVLLTSHQPVDVACELKMLDLHTGAPR